MVKKLILLGLGLTLLVGLPLAIFVLQNQTQTKSGAAASTKFTFTVPSSPVPVGQKFDVPIVVNPEGVNQVSFVKITFTYDGTKLDKGSTSPVTIDTTKYTVLEQPSVSCNDANLCQVSFTISVGSNQNAVIKSATTVATMNFAAKADTDPGSPTHLTFVSGQNQALSTAQTDQAAENVFQAGVDGLVTIGADAGSGGQDSPTPTGGTGGNTPTDTPVPTDAGGGGTGGTSGGGTTDNGITATCSSFTADTSSGAAPLDVTFTVVGNSTNDSIAKITINYGDGLVDTIASGSGVGTGDVNGQVSHSYSNNGTFTASATLTTTAGNTSNPATCQKTITVGSGTTGNLPPTGPGETLLFLGAAGAVLTVIGVAVIAGL
ncbi:MAG TPA: cohesin domain-containing protein [Patescibacteria group bacterium]